MLRCARCLGRTARQDLVSARCRLTSASLAPAPQTQARRYISSGDLDRELGKLLGTSSDSLKGGKNPGNLVPGKNKWIKSKKQPRSFELDVGGLAGLAKDASGGSNGSGKSINGTQHDRRRGDANGNEGRTYGNGKGRDTRPARDEGRSNGPGHGQGSRSHSQGQGARFGMKREATGPGPGAGNRDRNFDRQSGPSTSISTPRIHKNKNNNEKSVEPVSEIDAEADADEPVVVEDEEGTARKSRFGPPKSGTSSGSSGQGKGDKKSHAKSRTSFHKLTEPAYPAQPGSHSHSHSHGKRKNPSDSLLSTSSSSSSSSSSSANSNSNSDSRQKSVKKDKDKVEPKFKVEREVYIPPISVKVGDLARMVDVRLGNLQARMRRMGMSEEECHSDNCEWNVLCTCTSQRICGARRWGRLS